MQLELIIGGIALLIAVVTLKKFIELSAFQCLVRTFTVLWAALAALHFWPLLYTKLPAFLPELQTSYHALIAFWAGFLLACVPGIVLIKKWLGRYSTTFPYLIDGILRYTGAGAAAVALLCVVLMSGSVYGYPNQFNPKKFRVRMDLVPLKTYIWTASSLSAYTGPGNVRKRIPSVVERLLKQPGNASTDSEQSQKPSDQETETLRGK